MKRLVKAFLLTRLIAGTRLVIFSNHWFPIWLGLELRTLSIIPLLRYTRQSRRVEATLKYFLVQAFRAALLLKGAVLNLWIRKRWDVKRITSPISYFIITAALIIKLGLAPCHFWFPDVLRGLPFLSTIIIACWQKIAPMFLLLSLSKLVSSEIIIVCSILSVLVGGWGGLKQIRVRKILAYSSIGHLGWITCVAFFIPEVSYLLFLFYILKKTAILLICHKGSLYYLSSLRKSKVVPITAILFSIALLSLGGLPPLGGFIKKVIPLIVFSLNGKNFIIPFFLIGRLIRLFFYIRIVFKTRLTLFPQHRLKIVSSRTGKRRLSQPIISTLIPITIWGLLLLPIFFLFI